MPLTNEQRSRCLSVASEIAETILDRAKTDGREIYWELGGPAKSNNDRRTLELSLGFGTPGILLFLALYYSFSQDKRVIAYTERAIARARRRISETNRKPGGFYIGSLGSCFALRKAEFILGDTTDSIADHSLIDTALASLRDQSSSGSGLSNGSAGTLLSLDLLSDTDAHAELLAARETVIQQLVQQLALTRQGLTSGRHFDAIQSPVGFFAGNAGICYALAPYSDQQGAQTIIDGLATYQETAFDEKLGNWKDYINEEYYNDPANTKRLNRSILERHAPSFQHFGDTIGWGAGTAGILLSCITKSCDKGPSPQITRAIRKIASSLSELRSNECGFSLYNGWGGVAIVLKRCETCHPDPVISQAIDTIVDAALEQHAFHGRFKLGPWNEASPLGLLSGESGIGYFLLQMAGSGHGEFLLGPSASNPIKPLSILNDQPSINLSIANNSLPLTISLLSKSAHRIPAVRSLGALLSWADSETLLSRSELAQQALAFERSRLDLEDRVLSNLYLAGREAYLKQAYSAVYKDAGNDIILNGKFRLLSEARLGLLDFRLDYSESPSVSDTGQTLVLILVKSGGLHDWIIGSETYAVLKHLNGAKSVAETFRLAWNAWPLNAYIPKVAAQRVVNIIKDGLAAGYVESATT